MTIPVPVSAAEVFSLLYIIPKWCICMFLHLCILLFQCYTTPVMVTGSLLFNLIIFQPKIMVSFFWNVVPGWGEQSGAAVRDWGWPGPHHCWAWAWDGVVLDQLGSNRYWKNASPKRPKIALFFEKSMLFLNPLNWRNLSQSKLK